ncbi:MAG: hypothetical protein KDB53_16490 [Planctomycetes bacterium]|nr:hypothetical protein [Planctomycetota bacterium]
MISNRLTVAALSLVVLTGSAFAQEATAAKYKFTWKAPKAGTVQGIDGKGGVKMAMDIFMGGELMQSMETTTTHNEKKKTTVLALDGAKISKFKVAYETISNETDLGEMGDMVGDLMPEDKAAALVGKTYVVTLAEAGPSVTAEDGTAVEAEVSSTVLERELADGQHIGWHMGLDQVFPDRELAVGEVLKIDGKAAERFFPEGPQGGGSGPKVKVALTFTGTKKVLGVECGVFDADFEISGGEDRGLKISGLPKGELLVGISNLWIYGFKMDGDMKVEGGPADPEMPIEMNGKIKVDMNMKALYGSAE